jgi:hypothetical protein
MSKLTHYPDASQYKRKPRHKWFSQCSRDADSGWIGPCDTIEEAVERFWAANGDVIPHDAKPICYVAQGRKMTKVEIEEFGDDFTWQVETRNAFAVLLPPGATW